MSWLKAIGVCCIALVIAKCEMAPRSEVEPTTQKLTLREEPGRVVLAWSGPIETPMRDDIAAALDRLEADPRRLVLTLNSPGGSIEHGRAVMETIRAAAQRRPIDTLVEKGAVCASMCVPIYLLGARRMADPGAHFMFHEASIEAAAWTATGEHAAAVRKAIETLVTDSFYETDIGRQRVNAQWLAAMRTRIVGRDVWVSGQQLVDGGSGVVDALVRTTPN
ncbi:MAG: ATP-dependent Clp protease proteolytic subunit [Roseiarcus sp.]|jgi:ATP-dependent protease ClpP protease subunit